jgi:Ser/Thr protein kinase RdoA (MazF antagonist)
MPVDFDTLTYRGQVARLRELAIRALTHYDLGGDVTLRLQLHLANTTFRVTGPDGARYVLRVSQPDYRTDAELRSEAQWLTALHRDTDLGVPEPVANTTGEFLTTVSTPGIPEPRQCMLFRWVEGRFMRKGLRPVHLGRVGAFMAHLHDHATAWPLPDGFTRPRADARLWVGAWLQPGQVDPDKDFIRPHERHLLDQGAQQIHAQIAALGEQPDRFGLIHTDLHHGNYLFHRGEVRAIDFDDTGFEPYVYDFAVTLWALRRYREAYPMLRVALLDGYARVRPLPPGTDTHLDTFIVARDLIVTKYVINRAPSQPNIRRMVPHFLSQTLEAVRAYLDGSGASRT